MAEIRSKLIVELPVAQLYNGTEIFPIQQDGVTRKTTSQDIIDYTKLQDYATWVYKASSDLWTKSLTAGYITMIVDPSNDKDKPEFFIGESSFTRDLQLSGLSGFKFFYDEIKDNFIFTRSISSVSAIKTLTAYYIDQKAYTYINNLSTANTLSSTDIFTTNNITISSNNTTQSLYIVQKGFGYALKIDESSNTSPFIIDRSGNVSIKTDKTRADLTISGDTSASGSLSASKVFVWDNIGVATNLPNEKLTVNGNISSNNVIYDSKGNSLNWNSVYSYTNLTSSREFEARTFVGNNSANILQVNSVVNNTSANWNSVYSDWNSLSAFDNRVRTFVGNNSANQLSIYSHYNTNSSTFLTKTDASSTYVKKSGDTISYLTDTGFLNVSGNSEFAADVIVRGRLSAFSVVQISPTLVAQSANSLNIDTSATIGQKLIVNGEAFLNSLYVTTNAVVTGSITSNTSVTAPVIYGGSGNSNNWNSTHNEWTYNKNLLYASTTFTGNNSANQLSVYSSVRSNSADWESIYSDWNSVSAFDNRVRTFVGLNSSAILEGTSSWNNVSSFYLNARTFTGNNSANQLSVYSSVVSNSADWESIYSDWNSVSAFDNRVRTFVGNNSANQLSVYSFANLNSASWGTGGSYGTVYSRNSGTYLTNLSGDERYVRINNFPSLAYVPLSGGIMTGALTVNNPIYINYAGRTGNSTDWDNASDYYSASAGRISQAVTWLYANSGDLVPTEVRRLSSNWNSVYATYNANSAIPIRGTVNLVATQTIVNVPNYKVGSIDVYLNGIKLVNGVDFTATTGSTIVLTEPAKNNQYVLDYVAYGSFVVPNAILKTGDTMSGTLTVPQLIVTNQRIDSSLAGNTTGVHTGNVVSGNLDGSESNYIRTGNLSSINLNISGVALINIPSTSTKDGIQIINAGTGNSFYVSDGGVGDTTPTVIDNTGRFLHGYISAANIGGITPDFLQVKTGNSTFVNASYSNDVQQPDFRFVKSRGSTIESNTIVSNGDYLGTLRFYGSDGVDTANQSAAIEVQVAGTPAVDSIPSRMRFYTTNQGSTITPKVTIEGDGDIGIGLDSPTEKIHIASGNVRIQSGSVSVSGDVRASGVFRGDGSGLTNIDGDKAFSSFPEIDNYVGAGSLYRTTSFISKTNKLWVAGYCDGSTRLGLGDVNYADQGYHQVVALNLLAGEYIVKHYFQRYSQYILTNLGNIYATGYNAYGQLGLGDTTARNVFQRITTITNVTHFSCENGNDGAAFCTAVSNGKLYAWGYNGQYRFGTNDNVQRNSPQIITLGSIATKTIVKAYAIGDTYTSYGYIAAIDSNKNIHFCGVNGAGQFGIAAGDYTTRTTFVQHPTMLVDEYYGSMYNSYAVSFILYNGKLFTAGGYDTASQYGQLGNNGTAARQTFAEVIIPGRTFKSIAVCEYHGGSVAAIMNDGTLWTWGRNNQGQLGNGTTNNTATPGYTNLSNIVKVLGCDNAYCFFVALASSGELYVSGYNGYGQKGIATTDQNNYFSKVIKPADLKFIDFTCWGWNSGTGWTAADTNGDLWSCGYGGQWTTARRYVNNSNPYVVTRCNHNI